MRFKPWLCLIAPAVLAAACAIPDQTDVLSGPATVRPAIVAEQPAPPSDWRGVYDPFALRELHVRLSAVDLQTIRYDETFDIKVPAEFWMAGDVAPSPYPITIRRKSATPINDKISYRVAFSGPRWYDLKSLSLENGDDADVVREGLSWYLHRLAASERYQPGLAAWVTLTLHVVTPVLDEFGQPVLDENGQPVTTVDVRPQGVYLNVELPDKYFLKHRGIEPTTAWLYKQDDIGLPELKEPEGGLDSPAYAALTYVPFRTEVYSGKRLVNPAPADRDLAADMTRWVDMDAMLRLGAVNAFTDNPDDLFTHGKNFFWADFPEGFADQRRIYYPWDLDATIRSTTGGIYGQVTTGRGGKTEVYQHPYQQVLLNHPDYRAQYNQLMLALLDGPMGAAVVREALTRLEGVLSEALIADPNSKISDPASHFAGLRQWVAAREASVRSQVAANNQPLPRAPYPPVDAAPRQVDVAALTGSRALAKSGWAATAAVTVHDALGTAAAGAVVAMQWSGAASGTGTCTTDAAGQCAITRSGLKNTALSITFSVTGVTGTSLVYTPSLSEAATTVTIVR